MAPSLANARWHSVHNHTAVGFSTGCLRHDANDWTSLLRIAANESRTAVEFSALSEPELPELIDFLLSQDRLPFEFVSVHAPSKDRQMSEAQLVEQLRRIADRVDAIVFHPDQIVEVKAYRALGSKMVIENMDRRKDVGRTRDQLDFYLTALPDARLCLDVAHARHVDPTMVVGEQILRRNWRRLSHLHLSSVDDDGHHMWLTAEDENLFAPILDRCRDVPWILEAKPSDR